MSIVFEKVRDSQTGEIIEIEYRLCGICKQPIRNERLHASCFRQIEQVAAAEQERQRQFECQSVFGEVLDAHEHRRRLYPDASVDGRETYNKQLKRQALEKKEREDKIRIDKAERKRRVPFLIDELEYLKKQIAQDDSVGT